MGDMYWTEIFFSVVLMLLNAVAGLMVFVWHDGSCGDEAVRIDFSAP